MPRAGATQSWQSRGISNLNLETNFIILGILQQFLWICKDLN
jgi:hypothetical protein